MNSEIELKLLQEIEELKKQIAMLRGAAQIKPPIYQYSKIRDVELKTLFAIEKKLNPTVFDTWFNNEIVLTEEVVSYLQQLIEYNSGLIEDYNEEELKIYLISPLISKVNFLQREKEIRGFYEMPLHYATEQFILTGTADFVVSQGLVESKKPYFFIQEFKRSEDYGNPRPQLLAELISAVELNDWQSIKGAYVTGSHWRFAILEKLSLHKYQYFISDSFDSTKIKELKAIFKNLLFIKNEILAMVEEKSG